MSTTTFPWWLTDGLVFAGGWHPLAARVRRTIPAEDIEADYEWEYSEEHVRRLKELGITMLLGQFDRGLGDTDSAEDHERARELASICHAHGIRHGVYLANSIYFESMLKDHPDCESWAVHTYDGLTVHYGGQQTFRWIVCFNSPGWRARMKRIIEKAIKVVGTDLLHFDNLAVWPEPDSCHCPACQEAFRAFLSRRYPDACSQKRRFGFTGFDTFRAPNFYMRFNPPWSVDRVENPLMQEWIAFRQHTVTDYIAEMAAYARSLKPDICIDSNGQSIFGFNQALVHGIDQEAQAGHVDFVHDENPDLRPDDDPEATDPSSASYRSALFYRRLGKPCVSAYRDEAGLAFNLTFRGHPGIHTAWGYAEPGRAPLSEPTLEVKKLLDHFRRHRDLYLRAGSAARVAVWRSRQSLAYVSTDTHLSACVFEHLLFVNCIPFSIIMDGMVEKGNLTEFDLIILPDVELVSQQQVEILTGYVASGGGLLISERTGIYTAEPRKRSNPAFVHLFQKAPDHSEAGIDEAFVMDPNRQFAMRFTTGSSALGYYGKGRVAYLPEIRYRYRARHFKSGYNVHYDGIDSRYWKEPYNRTEILDTIEWLAPSSHALRSAGCPNLRLDLTRLADGRLAIPLLRTGSVTEPRDIALTIPVSMCEKQPLLFVPERETAISVTPVIRDGQAECLIPGLGRHGILVLSAAEAY